MLRVALVCLVPIMISLRPAGDAGSLARDLVWWTTHALEKVRPSSSPPPPAERSTGVELAAARNEFEPFQLVLRARSAPLRDVDVELTDLVGERGGDLIASRWATVYLQRYLALDKASSIEGATGEWPDPLIPRIDAYRHERRSAFPFEIPAGRNQPLWIELYVPPDTPPDVYRGALRISAGGRRLVSVPVRVEVWSFRLPSTSTLRTSFGFSGPAVLIQHRGRYTSDEDLFALSRLYAIAALRHRLSLHGGAMVPPPARFERDRVVVDWTDFDRRVEPLLDGTLFGAADYLPGARITSIDVTTIAELTPEQTVRYWRAWADHFRARGWLDQLFVYLLDEPQSPEDYAEVVRRARLARTADPGLQTLLTEQLVPRLARLIDIWVPLVNCVEPRSDGDRYCEETVPRERYHRVEEQGAAVWWYQSCASHGCNELGDAAYTGWPSHAIDASAVAHRIMPWLAWRLGISGELYYNTVESYLSPDADPWRDVRLHGGNGDGTLFYPGTPERIGGATDVPVESIRLKLIREGLEDYEYLALAERSGLEELARANAVTVAASTYGWSRDPDTLYAAKFALGRALDGHGLRKQPTVGSKRAEGPETPQ